MAAILFLLVYSSMRLKAVSLCWERHGQVCHSVMVLSADLDNRNAKGGTTEENIFLLERVWILSY